MLNNYSKETRPAPETFRISPFVDKLIVISHLFVLI